MLRILYVCWSTMVWRLSSNVMHSYFKLSNWRRLPSLVRAYMYLFEAGWNIFVRRQSAQMWSQKWGNIEPDTEVAEAQWTRAQEASKWISVAARIPFSWARCLQRSMALSMWMDAKGMSPVLKIGVRRSTTGIDAHSWVEFNGRVLNDSEYVGVSFTAFELPGQQPTRRVSGLKRD